MKKLFALCLIVFPLVANAATFWSFDWETLPYLNANTTEGIAYQGNCFEKALGDPFNSVELSTKYVRSGTYSARLYTDSKYANTEGHRACSSMWKTETITVNGVTYLKHRLEPVFGQIGNSTNDFNRYQLGEERWFRWSFYFPSNEGTFNYWNTGPYASKGIMIMQLMASNNPSNANDNSHEVALILSGGPKIKVENVYGVTGSTAETHVDLGTYSVKKDSWNDVVVMHLPHHETGKLKVWLNCADWANCTPIVNRSGPTAIPRFLDRYWKGGNYEMNFEQYDRAIAQYVDSHKMGKKDAETEAQMLALMSDAFTTEVNPNPDPEGTSFIYTDDFQANLPIEHERNFLNKKCRGDQYTRVLDPFNPNSGNYVFKAFLDGDVGCDESGTIKYRTQLTFGINGDNGSPLYVNQNEHTWLSYKLYVDPTTPDGSKQTFVQAQEVGESAMMVVGNDTLRVIPERYRVWNGSDFGSLVENRIVDLPIAPGQWHTITTRIYKRTSTQNDGEYELWLNGVKKIDLKGIITGSDLAASGSNQATYDLGPYHGDSARAGNTTYYIDDIKFARGKNNYTLFGFGNDLDVNTSDMVINNGNPVSSNQDPINFTVNNASYIHNCTMGGTTQSAALPVKFDFTTSTSGKFAGVDTTGFSSTGTVTCYDLSYVGNVDVPDITYANVSLTSITKTTGLDHWGYTEAKRLSKTPSGNGVAYFTYGGTDTALRAVKDDLISFDINYSCTGTSCQNLLFDFQYPTGLSSPDPTSKRIRFTGTAGALAWEDTSEPEFGTSIEIINYTMPDNVYRASVRWKASENAPQNYKAYAGWGSASGASLTLDMLEVIMRKNWTTKVLTAPILYSIPDSTAPTVNNCTIGNNPNGEGGYQAVLQCSANEIGGIDYAMITTSNTSPDETAMKAATNAIWSSQKSADSQTILFEANGMSYQNLWGWIMRCDAATIPNCSAVQGAIFTAVEKILQLGTSESPINNNGLPLNATYTKVVIYDKNILVDSAAKIVTILQNVPVIEGVANPGANYTMAGYPSLNTIPNGEYWVLASRPSGASYAMSYSKRNIVEN